MTAESPQIISADEAPDNSAGSDAAAALAFERMLTSDEDDTDEDGGVAIDTDDDLFADEEDLVEEDAEDEDVGDDEESEEDAEDEDGADPDDAVKVTVGDGEKSERVTIADLKASHAERAATRAEREALTAERATFDSTRDRFTKLEAEYAALLPAMKASIAKTMPQAPDPQLAIDDPLEYVAQKAKFDMAMESIASIEGEQKRLDAEKEEKAKADHQVRLNEVAKQIVERFPEWLDEKTFIEADNLMKGYVVGKLKANTDEWNFIMSDARLIEMAHDAAKYRAAKERLAAKAKAAQAPSGPKTAAPTSRPAAPKQKDQLTRATERLRKTGSTQDAAIAFSLLK